MEKGKNVTFERSGRPSKSFNVGMIKNKDWNDKNINVVSRFWRRRKLLHEALDHQGLMQMAGDESWYQATMVMQVTIYAKQ